MAQRRLSLQDSNFLQAESPEAHMHFAALMVFELPADAGPRFVAETVQRMRQVRVFSNPWNYRLRRGGRFQLLPLLEEVHDIDMEYHVRHLALPQPCGERELGQLISRLHTQQLDRFKPLWEVHVIEGLENQRFAVYLKMHHCLADGHSATILLTRALSRLADASDQLPWWAHPDETTPAVEQNRPRPRTPLPRLADVMKATGQAARTLFGKPDGDVVSLRSSPHSILNARLHTQRRFATHSEPLSRLKTIARAAGATLNDVVLALTGSVLRDYLVNHDALPERSMTAMIPVSLHPPGSKTLENNITFVFATLGTDVADDKKRLERVKRSADGAKARLWGLPPGTSALYSGMVLSPVMGQQIARLAGRSRPFYNTVVSNVPGPKDELYLYGARFAHLYPVSLPVHGAGLNVSCFTHADTIDFGFIACRDTVPHVQQMAVALGEAVNRLEAAYGIALKAAAPRLVSSSAA